MSLDVDQLAGDLRQPVGLAEIVVSRAVGDRPQARGVEHAVNVVDLVRLEFQRLGEPIDDPRVGARRNLQAAPPARRRRRVTTASSTMCSRSLASSSLDLHVTRRG